MRPVPHSDDLPVPTPPVNKDLLSSSDEEMLSREDSAESISLEDIESTYSGTSGNEPHCITQEDLNDLARDLCLSKQQSELLASRLKQWNLVQEDVRIISFRNRNKDLTSFFDMVNKLCYCTNIPGLFTSLGLPHNPSDWSLFIDSSKRSLKGVLHNGNKYPSIPIVQSVHLKESYDNMELLLEAIKYSEYQWSLCGASRSLVFLWVCKRASQSTVVFSVSGIVELYPSITSRKTGVLETLLCLENTASRRILWWTWIRCFFLLFTSSLVWWRISWRRCTKMVLPSNTCLLCSQVFVLQSSKRASLSDLRSEKCWRILILRSFLT